MERLTRDEMLMGIAEVTAQRGTCSRLQVGAVFSKDGRILVNGYNGVPKNQPHCNHDCDCLPTRVVSDDGRLDQQYHEPDCASKAPCLTAQHAERNAIDFAARHGLSLEESILHVTHMPCLQCAGSLLNVGVWKVIYKHAYRLDEGVRLLERNGIVVVDYNFLVP